MFFFIILLAIFHLLCEVLLLFSHKVMSSSLRPHGLKDARVSYPSVSWSLLKLMSIELMMPSNHFILCCFLLFLPLVFLSIRVFSVLHIRWPNYWSFSFSISPSNEYSGLIYFRMDWFDLLCSPKSRVFSSTTIQKHHFFSTQPS